MKKCYLFLKLIQGKAVQNINVFLDIFTQYFYRATFVYTALCRFRSNYKLFTNVLTNLCHKSVQTARILYLLAASRRIYHLPRANMI